MTVKLSAGGSQQLLGRIFQVRGDGNIMCDTGQQSEIPDKYKITPGTDTSPRHTPGQDTRDAGATLIEIYQISISAEL